MALPFVLIISERFLHFDWIPPGQIKLDHYKNITLHSRFQRSNHPLKNGIMEQSRLRNGTHCGSTQWSLQLRSRERACSECSTRMSRMSQSGLKVHLKTVTPQEFLNVLQWPSRSPDLDPVKHPENEPIQADTA